MENYIMDKITVSISKEQNKKLDKLNNTEYENKSEAIRGLSEKGMKYNKDIKKKDKKIKRLENEKQKNHEQREEHQELVKFT